MERKERKRALWEKYLYLWVILCILAGTALGRVHPQRKLAEHLARLEVAVVGVLTEVPIMLFLVWLCKRTRGFFK
jgi:ACR3 family arsenite efflux pump ArsB